jgi:hypothetical protein
LEVKQVLKTTAVKPCAEPHDRLGKSKILEYYKKAGVWIMVMQNFRSAHWISDRQKVAGSVVQMQCKIMATKPVLDRKAHRRQDRLDKTDCLIRA